MIDLVMLQCSNIQCNLRFPAPLDDYNVFCPLCGERLIVTQYVLDNGYAHFNKLRGFRLECVLDNIRSAYNVGSILRSANAFGLDQIYLCGVTPSPTQSKVRKTSLGSEKTLSWKSHPNALDLVHEKKELDYTIYSIEACPTAQSLLDIGLKFNSEKILFILGNEIYGIDPEIRICSDAVLQIPIWGQKKSLNVATSFSIAAFYFSQLSR
ncbi:MAG TPA: RNA methyltransferase [Anaerolineaceae bacterium]|uniref:Putative RNA methyltransferase n=1 Tax=Anaerolinea thermophila TaxID=167964 RepID=A0A117LH10_9CHLR|nr:MAG: Putative RNA methyltransferase [Anaerolinea thermophila]HAF61338.1 RNA methyltransferase [Anaerolineaceae bacterium]